MDYEERRKLLSLHNDAGPFALYGFPESHAADFALLAYATRNLKDYQAGGRSRAHP